MINRIERQVLSVKEASELSGFASGTIRELMKRGLIDIGVVVEPKKKGGHKKYYVFRNKLLKAIGAIDTILSEGEEDDRKRSEFNS